MAKVYTIVRRNHAESVIATVSSKRRPTAEFLLEQATYDMAESQGLRDTRAAWRARDHARLPIVDCVERRIELGSQSVTLSIGVAS